MKSLIFVALTVSAVFLAGCTYMINPKNEALRKADMLERQGKYPEADSLRKEAATLPESAQETYIPILQGKPAADPIQNDISKPRDKDTKDMEMEYPTYTPETK